VKQAKNWDALVDGWKKELEALGSASLGRCSRRSQETASDCRYCDLQTLCRVYERVNALSDEDEDADVGSG